MKLKIEPCKFKYTEEEIKKGYKNNPSWNENDYGRINETKSSHNEDYCIWGLDEFFKEPTLEKSLELWKIISEASRREWAALYQPNKSQKKILRSSQVIHQLRNLAWIPDKSGNFHKPSDISRSNIHKDFSFDAQKDLLKELGLFNKEGKEKAAKILGSVDILS